jgi:hypothetical protein
MRKLCFTERSLQFSKIAHKSLGSSNSPSPLFSSLGCLPFSPTSGTFLWFPSLSPPRFPPPSLHRRRTGRRWSGVRGAGKLASSGGSGAGAGRAAGRCSRERLGARRWRRWRGAEQRPQRAGQLGAAGGTEPAAPGGTRERASAGLARASGHWSGSRAVQERNVGGAEWVAQACARWRAGAGGVCRCWAAGAERAHGHKQAVLECGVRALELATQAARPCVGGGPSGGRRGLRRRR